MRLRGFTYVIIAINVAFVLLFVLAVLYAIGDMQGAQDAAKIAEIVGTRSAPLAAQSGASMAGIGAVLVTWTLVDVILGVLWLVTRPSAQV